MSSEVRTPDKSKKESGYKHPSFLPDGRHFLYVAPSSERGPAEVRVAALDSNDDKVLFPGNSRVLYSNPNHLLYVRDGTLLAQPFDLQSLALAGDAFPVAERIGYNAATGTAAFSVSGNGTLIYRSDRTGTTSELVWFERSGKRLEAVQTTGTPYNPVLSPDQNRIAVERRDTSDIWLIDLLRGTNSRFTFDAATDLFPVFSP